MTTLLEKTAGWLREFAGRLSVTRDAGPIDSLAEIDRFCATRASFVAQKKLYGYLKTRMGMRYPQMFEDDGFVASINVAKLEVFAACLSDLTIHAIACATAGSGLPAEQRCRAASETFRTGLASTAAEAAPDRRDAWIAEFETRLASVAWENIALGHEAFVRSPKALVRWAPIADELKKYDAEIVRNSIRYAWNEVIRDYRQRAVPSALQSELRERYGDVVP